MKKFAISIIFGLIAFNVVAQSNHQIVGVEAISPTPNRGIGVGSDGDCRFPIPDYPIAARQNGHQGRVVVEFTIMKTGAITGIRVVASSGYEELDAAATKSVEGMVCERMNGEVTRKQPFDFSVSS